MKIKPPFFDVLPLHSCVFYFSSARGMSIREDGKVTVHVKLNFLKIGEIQTLKEVYNAEIYVQLR